MTINAIPTWYDGIKFRSRLEARWAVMFDVMGIVWEYFRPWAAVNQCHLGQSAMMSSRKTSHVSHSTARSASWSTALSFSLKTGRRS